MAQNKAAPAAPAAPKAPSTQAAQTPGKPAPTQGQALGQVKQDLTLDLPGVADLGVTAIDAATAAATAGDLEDAADKAAAAAEAAVKFLANEYPDSVRSS